MTLASVVWQPHSICNENNNLSPSFSSALNRIHSAFLTDSNFLQSFVTSYQRLVCIRTKEPYKNLKLGTLSKIERQTASPWLQCWPNIYRTIMQNNGKSKISSTANILVDKDSITFEAARYKTSQIIPLRFLCLQTQANMHHKTRGTLTSISMT